MSLGVRAVARATSRPERVARAAPFALPDGALSSVAEAQGCFSTKAASVVETPLPVPIDPPAASAAAGQGSPPGPYTEGQALSSAIEALLEWWSHEAAADVAEHFEPVSSFSERQSYTVDEVRERHQFARERLEEFRDQDEPYMKRLWFEVLEGDRVWVDSRLLREWADRLTFFGAALDDRLDQVASDATAARFGWLSGVRPVRTLLNTTVNVRLEVRAFERDVERYLVCLMSASQDIHQPLAVTETMRQVQATHQRAFDLCVLKLNIISNGRATLASLLLGLLALVAAMTGIVLSLIG